MSFLKHLSLLLIVIFCTFIIVFTIKHKLNK